MIKRFSEITVTRTSSLRARWPTKSGELAVADTATHLICFYRSGFFVRKWGSKQGNQDGPIESTQFDSPIALCFEGNTAYVTCEGREFGARIVRCASLGFLKTYFQNCLLLYKLVGYVCKCRRDSQANEERNVLLPVALQNYGWPAYTFFDALVNLRRSLTGRYLKYVTLSHMKTCFFSFLSFNCF